MTQLAPHPDHLLDRPWRPGHPFRPRNGPWRRWGMFLFFCFLCAIIGGYWYLTEPTRVRAMAETYLSRLLGGPVKIGGATLSIFEGLRLDNVEVRVDNKNLPDSIIFSAETFVLSYDPKSMLRGRIEARQIIAKRPH